MKNKVFTTLVLGVILTGGIFAQHYEPVQIKGRGMIIVDAEYTTYQNITRTREFYVPGTLSGGNSYSSGGVMYGGGRSTPGHIETETYTERVAVKADYNLSFRVLENGFECFRGTTPIRVGNFDPGVTYKIIWMGSNGIQKEGTFVITTASPFIRYIHLE